MKPVEIELHPGHWVVGTGARGIIDEVTEARKVTKRVYEILQASKIPSTYFEDNTSKSQAQNLNTLVGHHNKDKNGLVVSVHFNASAGTVDRAIGTEVLYYDQKKLAEDLSKAMAQAGGFKNRGAKQNKNIAVLANTYEPAVLLEVCFVNSKEDVALYRKNFEGICQAIARVLANYLGKELKLVAPVVNVKPVTETEKKEEIELNETGRTAAKNMIKRGVAEGYFKSDHKDLEKYDDKTLMSYALAYLDRKTGK